MMIENNLYCEVRHIHYVDSAGYAGYASSIDVTAMKVSSNMATGNPQDVIEEEKSTVSQDLLERRRSSSQAPPQIRNGDG